MAGTLTLSNTNSYTGATTINGPFASSGLTVGSVGALSNGAINFTSGVLNNSVGANFALANPLNLTNSVATFANTVANRTTFTGPITLTGNNQIFGVAAGSTTLFAGVVSGTGSLNLDSGELVLQNANNTYGSATTGTNVGGGNLQVNSSDTVVSGSVTKGPLGVGPVNLTGGVFQNANTGVADFVVNSVNNLSTTQSISSMAGAATIGGPAIGTAAAGGDLNLAGPVNIFGPNNTPHRRQRLQLHDFRPDLRRRHRWPSRASPPLYLPNANPGWTGGITLNGGTVSVGNNNSARLQGLVTYLALDRCSRRCPRGRWPQRHHP